MHPSLKVVLVFILLAIIPRTVRTEGDNRGSLIVVDNEDTDVEIADDNSTPISDEIFYPTNEWQEIKPDQAIPKGLHVRINLQTGLKEAKLMENAERETNSDYLKHLKDITKDMKKKKFRNIDELKRDLHDMNMNVKSDYEIMQALVTKLKEKSTSDEQKLYIYEDLEYYVHQFDNGQNFVKMKGIESVLPDFNSTDEDLRGMAAYVLGSAVQSNPQVQIAALESGLLQVLLRVIMFDSAHIARGHSLYALSCLIRHFPLAQQKFLQNGGLFAMTKLFETKSNEPKDLKLQIKVITLIADLLGEQLSTAEHSTQTDKHQEEKKRQYDRVQLKLNLVEQGWCDQIPRPLIVADHDGREKVMEAMILLAKNCRSEFIKSRFILRTMHFEYTQLSIDEMSDNAESSDKYFTHLKEMVEDLLRVLNDNKDEL